MDLRKEFYKENKGIFPLFSRARIKEILYLRYIYLYIYRKLKLNYVAKRSAGPFPEGEPADSKRRGFFPSFFFLLFIFFYKGDARGKFFFVFFSIFFLAFLILGIFKKMGKNC